MLTSIHWHVYDAPLNQASFPWLQYFISSCYQTEHQKTVACCYFRVYRSITHQDGMVSVVTWLWAEHSGVQFLLRQEIFSSKISWAPSLAPYGYPGFFPRGKAAKEGSWPLTSK